MHTGRRTFSKSTANHRVVENTKQNQPFNMPNITMKSIRNVFRRNKHPTTHKNTKTNPILPSSSDEPAPVAHDASECPSATVPGFRASPSVSSSLETTTNPPSSSSWEELYASTSFVDEAFPAACSFVQSLTETSSSDELSSATAAHSFVSAHFKGQFSHTHSPSCNSQVSNLEWSLNETVNGTAIVGAVVNDAGENSTFLSFVFRNGDDEVQAIVQHGSVYETALLMMFRITNKDSAVVVAPAEEPITSCSDEISPQPALLVEEPILQVPATSVDYHIQSMSECLFTALGSLCEVKSLHTIDNNKDCFTRSAVGDQTSRGRGIAHNFEHSKVRSRMWWPPDSCIRSDCSITRLHGRLRTDSWAVINRMSNGNRLVVAPGNLQAFVYSTCVSPLTSCLSPSSSFQLCSAWASMNRMGDGVHNGLVVAQGKMQAFDCSNRFFLLTPCCLSSTSSFSQVYSLATMNRMGDGVRDRLMVAPGKVKAFVCSNRFILLTSCCLSSAYSFSQVYSRATTNRVGDGVHNRLIVASGKMKAFVCSIRFSLLTSCCLSSASSFSQVYSWASMNRMGEGVHNRLIVAPGKMTVCVCSICFTLLTSHFSPSSCSQAFSPWVSINEVGEGVHRRLIFAPGKTQACVCFICITLLTSRFSSSSSLQAFSP